MNTLLLEKKQKKLLNFTDFDLNIIRGKKLNFTDFDLKILNYSQKSY
jgi:hypothetical protein